MGGVSINGCVNEKIGLGNEMNKMVIGHEHMQAYSMRGESDTETRAVLKLGPEGSKERM